MSLADFIAANSEAILSEWVEFAGSCGPAGQVLDVETLRDHAAGMLQAMVKDLRTPQSAEQQAEKSKGEAPSAGPADTPAEVHGAERAELGFSIGEMVSEYRALRASVIRLWTRAEGTLTAADIEDLMRFNEAIDQALAESVARYAQDIDRSKEMFVAILGHDLRTPLGAVIMASQYMLDTGGLDGANLTLTTRIASSARRMNHMVGDLLDFTRGRLGSGVPIVRAEVDLGVEAAHAVDEMRIAHPGSVLELRTSGDLRGYWDAARLGQVMTNLLGNAVQHGAPGGLVVMTLSATPDDVTLSVSNSGTSILASDLPGIFSPFKRLSAINATAGAQSSLGLGLYIAERIVAAHGGVITARSSDALGTTFTVCLPRQMESSLPVP